MGHCRLASIPHPLRTVSLPVAWVLVGVGSHHIMLLSKCKDINDRFPLSLCEIMLSKEQAID